MKCVIAADPSEVNSLAGQAVGGVKAVEPARKIVEDMVTEAPLVVDNTLTWYFHIGPQKPQSTGKKHMGRQFLERP